MQTLLTSDRFVRNIVLVRLQVIKWLPYRSFGTKILPTTSITSSFSPWCSLRLVGVCTRRQSSCSEICLQFSAIRGYSFTAVTMNEPRIFLGHPDRFQGVTVDSMVERCSVLDFEGSLRASLNRWKVHGVRGVWFKVALEHAGWVPYLAQNGFQFHHAQPSFVTMVTWLPEHEVCNIPQYANTMLGVGAVVINEKRELLVVSEKYGNYPHWKLPGGYVEPGEEISSAAEREVLEETSVRAHFKSLISFRHMHNGMFGCSDLYYIVALTPEEGQEVLKKCDREIAALKWMKIDEYLNHPNVHSTNRFFVKKYLECEANDVAMSFHTDTHPLLRRPYKIYSLNFSKNALKQDGSTPVESTSNKL